MPYMLQYDMGLRLWVLNGPDGQVLATYLSRATALKDRALRSIVENATLRIRNADGTFVPVERRERESGLPQYRHSMPSASSSLVA